MSLSPLLRRAVQQRFVAASASIRGLASTSEPSTNAPAVTSSDQLDPSQVDEIFLMPERIPPTHNQVVCNLHFRSFNSNPLDFYVDFVRKAAAALTVPCSGKAYLPTKTQRWTVPRSPFVHKKSQENFERKHHKRLLQLKDANPETLRFLVNYIYDTCPAGIGVKVTTWEHEAIGVGARMEKEVGDELHRIEQGLLDEDQSAASVIDKFVKEFDQATGGDGSVSIAAARQGAYVSNEDAAVGATEESATAATEPAAESTAPETVAEKLEDVAAPEAVVEKLEEATVADSAGVDAKSEPTVVEAKSDTLVEPILVETASTASKESAAPASPAPEATVAQETSQEQTVVSLGAQAAPAEAKHQGSDNKSPASEAVPLEAAKSAKRAKRAKPAKSQAAPPSSPKTAAPSAKDNARPAATPTEASPATETAKSADSVVQPAEGTVDESNSDTPAKTS